MARARALRMRLAAAWGSNWVALVARPACGRRAGAGAPRGRATRPTSSSATTSAMEPPTSSRPRRPPERRVLGPGRPHPGGGACHPGCAGGATTPHWAGAPAPFPDGACRGACSSGRIGATSHTEGIGPSGGRGGAPHPGGGPPGACGGALHAVGDWPPCACGGAPHAAAGACPSCPGGAPHAPAGGRSAAAAFGVTSRPRPGGGRTSHSTAGGSPCRGGGSWPDRDTVGGSSPRAGALRSGGGASAAAFRSLSASATGFGSEPASAPGAGGGASAVARPSTSGSGSRFTSGAAGCWDAGSTGDGGVGVPASRGEAVGADGGTFAAGLSPARSEEHTSELQSRGPLVCRLLLEKKNNTGGCRVDFIKKI